MIPSDPKTIEQLKELADRNIANGDWGDESNFPGMPDQEIPVAPKELDQKLTVGAALIKARDKKLPRK